MTYLLVDGENVDSTLGAILGKKPDPTQRPRWDRVITFVEELWGDKDEDLKAFFFLNVKKTATIPYKFLHVLQMVGFETILLQGENASVVDEGIKKTLELLTDKEGHIVLVTHDHGYCDLLNSALTQHNRNLAMLGFSEFISAKYSKELPVQAYDLERDVNAFIVKLERDKVVPLDTFDPTALFKNS